MARERDSKSRLGGADRRPHHISSIAHHFLDETTEVSHEPVKVREMTFCGPGRGSLIAWVCAGTLRHLVKQGVLLAESATLPWSAASFLQDLPLIDFSEPDHPAICTGEDSRFWSVPVDEGVSQLNSQPWGATPELLIRNLGTLNNHQLTHLEAAAMQPSSLGGSCSGSDLVLWCLTPSEANSLAGAYTLGRALALMKPRHLEVMVLPENFLQAGSPSAQGTAPLLDEGVVARCRQLVSTVAKSQSCGFSLVSPESPADLASPQELLARLLDELLGMKDSD